MLATLAKEPFSDAEWFYEVKWDGFRIEAHVANGELKLFSRNGKEAETWFPDLAAATPTWIDAQSAIVDGEAVALDELGRPSFSLLQARSRTHGSNSKSDLRAAPITYFIFDLLSLNGASTCEMPFRERRELLKSVLRPNASVRLSEAEPEHGEAFYEAAAAAGLEGLIAKHRDSIYEPAARSRSWLKLKARPEQEFVVCGWEPGKSGVNSLGSLVLGVYENKKLVHAGNVGTGFTVKSKAEMQERLTAFATDQPTIPDAPVTRNVHWVEPKVVVRCEFAEWTHDNHVRQASFKGVELEPTPAKVRREEAQSTGEMISLAKIAALSNAKRRETK